MGHKNLAKDIDVKQATEGLNDAMEQTPKMIDKKKRLVYLIYLTQ